jgi:type II secretion system protein N
MSPLPPWQSIRDSLRALLPSRSIGQGAASPAGLGRFAGRLPVLSPQTVWLLYMAACFVLFLVLTFPSNVLLQRLVASLPRESGIRIRYAEGDCSWHKGCVLRELTLEGPSLRGAAVQLSRLALQPTLFGLVFGGQLLPLTFNAELYDGVVTGTIRQAVSGVSAQLALRQLALEQWSPSTPWGQNRLAGRVNATAEFLGNPTDMYALQGNFTISLTDGALRAGTVNGFPVPALQATQAHLRASLAAGRLEIAELGLTADGVEASLQGVITLRTPIGRSGLDLQLIAKSTGSPPPALKTLLALLPASPSTPGERRASISGSLAAPVVR